MRKGDVFAFWVLALLILMAVGRAGVQFSRALGVGDWIEVVLYGVWMFSIAGASMFVFYRFIAFVEGRD